jgi:hypothetical protein
MLKNSRNMFIGYENLPASARRLALAMTVNLGNMVALFNIN